MRGDVVFIPWRRHISYLTLPVGPMMGWQLKTCTGCRSLLMKHSLKLHVLLDLNVAGGEMQQIKERFLQQRREGHHGKFRLEATTGTSEGRRKDISARNSSPDCEGERAACLLLFTSVTARLTVVVCCWHKISLGESNRTGH